MLALTLKPGEKLKIGDTTVTVTEVKGNKIRIAIDAPKEIQISRGEATPPQRHL